MFIRMRGQRGFLRLFVARLSQFDFSRRDFKKLFKHSAQLVKCEWLIKICVESSKMVHFFCKRRYKRYSAVPSTSSKFVHDFKACFSRHFQVGYYCSILHKNFKRRRLFVEYSVYSFVLTESLIYLLNVHTIFYEYYCVFTHVKSAERRVYKVIVDKKKLFK